MVPNGKVRVCYKDEKTLAFHMSGTIEVVLDFLADKSVFNYAFTVPVAKNDSAIIIKSYKNGRNYLLYSPNCQSEIEEDWDGQSSSYCKITIQQHLNSDADFYIEELENGWNGEVRKINYCEARDKAREKYRSFYEDMPSVPPKYEEARKVASFVNWESYIHPCGYLHRYAMLMSKNWMTKVWSWDHCFNAIALSYKKPQEAWNQFMLMFDYQDYVGCIPDSVSDSILDWNYCKPPIHGWALSRMMEHMTLTKRQTTEVYNKLSKWNNWWLNFRDFDQDGLCEYTHGNDSGWDNSTAFNQPHPMLLPDLQAFLIIQMEVLASLAQKIGLRKEMSLWNERAKQMQELMIKKCFDSDGHPIARKAFTGEEVKTGSLLPYVSIILGDRLPKKIRETMISDIKNLFLTKWGLATEEPCSERYVADGYWRGPIWAPSTMLILDGLCQCGEMELVRDIAERFAEMFVKSGSAENYNALTGEGLRDRAYTWTSSAFLVMCHEYLSELPVKKLLNM